MALSLIRKHGSETRERLTERFAQSGMTVKRQRGNLNSDPDRLRPGLPATRPVQLPPLVNRESIQHPLGLLSAATPLRPLAIRFSALGK